jgi:hypothetical protein
MQSGWWSAGAIASSIRRNTGPNLAVTLIGASGGDVCIISTPRAVKSQFRFAPLCWHRGNRSRHEDEIIEPYNHIGVSDRSL